MSRANSRVLTKSRTRLVSLCQSRIYNHSLPVQRSRRTHFKFVKALGQLLGLDTSESPPIPVCTRTCQIDENPRGSLQGLSLAGTRKILPGYPYQGWSWCGLCYVARWCIDDLPPNPRYSLEPAVT